MACPFLREADVRYCEIAPFRKMIRQTAGESAPERCATPDYMLCRWAGSRPGTPAGALRCPFLREAMVQYCAAAPVTRFIPHSDALQSFCQSEGFRYCDLYAALAGADGAGGSAAVAGGEAAGPACGLGPACGHGSGCGFDEGAGPGASGSADGSRRAGPQAGAGALYGTAGLGVIEVPPHLAFAPNHMWLDLRADGSWHLGLDAFFARVVGPIEKVTFTTSAGFSRPAVLVTVRGTGLPMVFPNPIQVTALNAHLRGEPGALLREPYGQGWLCAGRADAADVAAGCSTAARGLLAGVDALQWMSRETARLDAFVRDQLTPAGPDGSRVINDGGSVRAPLGPHLEPEELLRLFQAFFAPERGGETA